MSGFEVTIPIDGSDYNEVAIINKRGDKYQLILGRRSKKDESIINWQMCYPQYDKKAKEIAVPWNIPLGNRDQAVSLLLQLLSALGHPATGKPSDDEGPPF